MDSKINYFGPKMGVEQPARVSTAPLPLPRLPPPPPPLLQPQQITKYLLISPSAQSFDNKADWRRNTVLFHSPKHCLDSTDDQNTPTKPFRSQIELEKLYQTYLEIAHSDAMTLTASLPLSWRCITVFLDSSEAPNVTLPWIELCPVVGRKCRRD